MDKKWVSLTNEPNYISRQLWFKENKCKTSFVGVLPRKANGNKALPKFLAVLGHELN